MNKQSMSGAHYLIRGFQLIGKREIRHFVIAPMLMSIFLFCGLLYLAGHYFSHLMHWVENYLPNWLQWLNWLLWVGFSLAFVIIFAYTFTLLANLVAAPFNSLLAERVEEYLTGKPVNPDLPWYDFIKDTPRTLGRELSKLFYYLPRALLCLILFLVPLIQVFAAVIWFIFNAWMMAIQYLDYPMDNHRIPFKTMRKELGQQYFANLGFGTLVMLMTMVPLLNFLVMPAAVAGATAMWVDQQ